jgi:hypothetical protein
MPEGSMQWTTTSSQSGVGPYLPVSLVGGGRGLGHKSDPPCAQQGSKSKAVAFGAEAMPDNDLVTFHSTEEFEATLM